MAFTWPTIQRSAKDYVTTDEHPHRKRLQEFLI